MEKKSDVFDCFRNLKSLVEREIERRLSVCSRLGEKNTFPASSIVRSTINANSVQI